MIAFALAQVGKRYVWGASGPWSYDCSGLIVASFRRVGLHLPHQTGRLIRHGRAVGRRELRPGDLVFPSSGHVQIYIGRGRVVEASNPRGGIRVIRMWGFWQARRLVG